jgi:hypothetical protein
MCLKIQCTNLVPNASIWQYAVGDTLCRQNSAEIDFWQTGWLARRRGSEKHPSEGSRRGARARHSLRKPVAPRFKNGALLKRQILKMISRTTSRSICDNLEKDFLVVNAAPNANPMQSCPFSLIWSLLSRTIDRSIDRSIVRLCLCLIHLKRFDSDRT